MGYKFIQRINSFVGISSDTKPLSAEIGSYLLEYDTGDEYVWDAATWRRNIGGAFRINPHVDLDIEITWAGGKPSVIEITGLGKTKTMTLTWDGDELDSIATVIT